MKKYLKPPPSLKFGSIELSFVSDAQVRRSPRSPRQPYLNRKNLEILYSSWPNFHLNMEVRNGKQMKMAKQEMNLMEPCIYFLL